MMMPALLLSALLLLLLVRAEPQQARPPLIFNKLHLVNSPENRVSVRMHAFSPDMTPLHAVLQFYTNHSAYHGALLIDRVNMRKYKRVASSDASSLHRLGNTLEVVTRSGHHTFSYYAVASAVDNEFSPRGDGDSLSSLDTSVVDLLEMMGVIGPSAGGAAAYDATLLMDATSGVWSHYNVALYTRHALTLSYADDGALPDTAQDYSNLVRLPCEQNPTRAPCVVASRLRVSDAPIEARLVLDLSSPFNYLPPDLYVHWQELPSLTLQLEANGDLLPLSKALRFVMHDADTVVLGADAIHHFPQLGYSSAHNTMQVWFYYSIQATFDQHEAVSIVLVLCNVATLICLFAWGTSYNYYVRDYVIYFETVAPRHFYYAYKQQFYELLVMLVAAIEWFLVGLYSMNYNITALFVYDHATQDQRKILLLVYSVVHFALFLLFMLAVRFPFKMALNWYTPRLYYLFFRAPPQEGQVRPLLKMTRMRNVVEAETGLSVRDRPQLYASLEERNIAEYGRTVFADIPQEALKRRLYDQVVRRYHDPLCKLPVPQVIVRNTLFIVLVFSNLLLAENFFVEYSNLSLLLLVLLSLGLTYYLTRALVIGIIFLRRFAHVVPLGRHKAFILFLVLEAVTLVLFCVFSYLYTYLPYFQAVNTGYDQAILVVFSVTLILLVLCFAVAYTLEKVDDYTERFIEMLERRRALRGGGRIG